MTTLTLSAIAGSQASRGGKPQPAKKSRNKPLRELTPLPALELFVAATKALGRVDGWFQIVLPYPPSVNALTTLRAMGKRIMKFPSNEAKQYTSHVNSLVLLLGTHPIQGRVDVRMDVYRPQQSGDLDNSFKAVFDCVKGVAWEDDRQVKRIWAEQHEDPNFPRVVLSVRPCAGETMTFAEFLK